MEVTPLEDAVIEWRTCGCTVWPIVVSVGDMLYPVRRCGLCRREPKHFVGDDRMSRTAAYEVARRTGLLDPDAPVHPVEQQP